MKRFLTVLLLVLALTACSSGGVSQEEYDELKSDYNTLKTDYDALKNELDALKTAQSQQPEPEPEPEPEPKAVDIAIHEDENVSIHFIGCEMDKRGDEQIVFMVENKTAVELSFQAGSFALDGLSLGHVSGSDSIAAQSKGKVRFETAEAFPTMNPSTLSGTIKVIDFGKTLWDKQSYEVTFSNIDVSGGSAS